MWEEWRAEIDRSLRDAQLAEDRWYDHEFRADLRTDDEKAAERSRLFSAKVLGRGGQARRDLPKAWRLRIAGPRARPIL